LNAKTELLGTAVCAGFHRRQQVYMPMQIISLTPRFSGVVGRSRKEGNRFNGFYAVCGEWLETVKTVVNSRPARNTQLKLGVNEKGMAFNTSLKRGVNESGTQMPPALANIAVTALWLWYRAGILK
jgi:hypothetical protein